MDQLHINWLTEGLIDFEYKKYQLLAYLQKVQYQFDKQKLYPHLNDLVNHHQYLTRLRDGKLELNQAFPKAITRINTEQWQIEYARLVEDEDFLKVIDEIIEYALPQFKQYLCQGAEQYNAIEEELVLSPVGLIPIDVREGYLMIRVPVVKRVNVYRYELNVFQQADDQYRSLKTTWVGTQTLSIVNTYNNIKYELIKRYDSLPNPATYVVEYGNKIPYTPTLYPIAKRALMKELSQAE